MRKRVGHSIVMIFLYKKGQQEKRGWIARHGIGLGASLEWQQGGE